MDNYNLRSAKDMKVSVPLTHLVSNASKVILYVANYKTQKISSSVNGRSWLPRAKVGVAFVLHLKREKDKGN